MVRVVGFVCGLRSGVQGCMVRGVGFGFRCSDETGGVWGLDVIGNTVELGVQP